MSAVVLLAPGAKLGPRFEWLFARPGSTIASHSVTFWLMTRHWHVSRKIKPRASKSFAVWSDDDLVRPGFEHIGPEIPLEELKALIPQDEIAMALAAAISA